MMFPEPDFFKVPKNSKQHIKKMTITKKRAYEAYIEWSSKPRALRDPKTVKEFEKTWKLPKGYTSSHFRLTADYHQRKMEAFWRWMFDRAPEVVYAVYRRATQNSTADAKIFLDMIGKRLEAAQPKPKLQPFVMVGVPQSKIDALFTPEGYEEAQVVNEKWFLPVRAYS